nr:hypothetical protein [Tanacetum cinerariifolium]
TFNSAFHFEERLRSLETSFSEYRQTNPFADAVSVIPGIRSDEQRHLYKVLVEAYEADKAILDTYGDSTILKRRREDDDQEGPSAGSNRGSKRQKEGGEQASASPPSEKATEGAGRSTTGQETHISQQRGSGTDEGTGSKPGVPDVPSDESEEELSWKSSDDEDKELAKDDDEETETGKGGDEVRESEGESEEEEETRQEEEESFDSIPRTPEESEEESNYEEDQDLRLNEEEKIQEEEDADELYRDVNINQGRGLQVTQNVEDTHVTLTSVNPDGPQKSSSMSLFVSSMLNPISDVGVELIFTTASSPIVSLQTPTPIMTPSTIATITRSSEAPIPPPTIPSIILENLLTFNSAFHFEERLRSLETSFSEYRQTNLFADAVSAIPGIVQQFMTQQMTKAIREAVQIQTDRLQDLLQRENDEFLRNIDENIKK